MKNKITILVLIVTIAILLFGFVMMRLINENRECVENPFTYSAQKSLDAGFPLECLCSFDSSQLNDFYFDEEGIEVIENSNDKPFWEVPELPNGFT